MHLAKKKNERHGARSGQSRSDETSVRTVKESRRLHQAIGKYHAQSCGVELAPFETAWMGLVYDEEVHVPARAKKAASCSSSFEWETRPADRVAIGQDLL